MTDICRHEFRGPKECVYCGWWDDGSHAESLAIVREQAAQIDRLTEDVATYKYRWDSASEVIGKIRDAVSPHLPQDTRSLDYDCMHGGVYEALANKDAEISTLRAVIDEMSGGYGDSSVDDQILSHALRAEVAALTPGE